MKIYHGLLLAAAVVIGMAAAQSRPSEDDVASDILLRDIPEISKLPFKSKDEEIAHLRSVVAKMRDEIIDRNDEIYMLRASESHATKAADNCTGGKYSEQFRFNTK